MSQQSPQHGQRFEKLLFYCEPLLTTAAVAKWLGVSTRAVCLWAECKIIPAIKVGRQWRFRADEVSKWLQSSGLPVRQNSGRKASAARI